MPFQKVSFWFQRIRNRHFLALDILIFAVAPVLALYLRLDGRVDWNFYQNGLISAFLVFGAAKLALLYFLGFYKRFWRMASIDELAYLVIIGFCSLLLNSFIFAVLKKLSAFELNHLPNSLPFMDAILSMILVSFNRFSVRLFERLNQRMRGKRTSPECRALIIGAGAAGTETAEEMQRSFQLGLNPVAFVDDDPSKQGLRLRGLPIAGTCRDISRAIKEYDIKKAVIAMPTADGQKIRQILNECQSMGVETLTVPGISEILNGHVNIEKIRKVQIEDLLRREPVLTETEKVRRLLTGRKVLVTGAGGSIGSELCRQILKFNPSDLILLGHGENSIFEIDQELKERKKEKTEGKSITTRILPRIADLRSHVRLLEVFRELEPEVVFHAAAHKHVPLMEANPQEAVTNNIIGTKNLVDIAVFFGVTHFISISTDKAVNPTNIMGASKRVTEMVILDAAKKSGQVFSAVRFGNVLGSRGSVVRTFQKQLENGGPITITHPDIIRYFMTIPEAVQLVLQASVLGEGGEVFMLDMGEPVKIIDLAKDMIRLAGLKEGVDVSIKCTGLRPGEKLFEELFIKGEKYGKTAHEKIMKAQNASRFVSENLPEVIDEFRNSEGYLTRREIITGLLQLVPEFVPDEIRNADKVQMWEEMREAQVKKMSRQQLGFDTARGEPIAIPAMK